MTEAPSAIDRGDWFVLRSGTRFYALSPRPEDVFISDIAFSLSNITRFAGQTQFMSVAEHSCRVHDHLPTALKLIGLLHDAPEGLGLMDLPRPIKHSELLSGYRDIEAMVWASVVERFGLPSAVPPLVKEVDNRALLVERNHLMPAGENTRNWPLDSLLEPLPCKVHCWIPEMARREFLKRYNELTQ